MRRIPINTESGDGESVVAIGREEYVADKLGKSVDVIDAAAEMLRQLPVLARPRDYGFQLDSLSLARGAILDGKALIEERLIAGSEPVTVRPADRGAPDWMIPAPRTVQ